MSDDNRNYNLNDDIPPEFPDDNGPPKFTKTEPTDSAPPQFAKKEKSDSIINSMFGSSKKEKGPKVSVPKGSGSKIPKTGLLLGGLIGLAVLIGVLAIMMLGGGGSVTAESLCSDTANNMRNIESYTSSVKMEMDAKINAEGQNVDFTMDSSYETDINLGPYKSHTVGNYIMSAAGQRESVDLEMYMEESDGKTTLYALQDGYWLKAGNYSVSEFDVDLFDKIGKGKLDAELAEDTVTIDGKEAYRLDVTLTGSDLANCFAGETEAVLGMDYSNIDWYDINAATKIYIYKDSKLPARIVIDASDIGDVFVSLMLDSAFGSGVSYDYTLNKYDVQFTYTNYNDVKTITIPSNVTGGSSTTEPDTTAQTTAEGTYQITNKNHTVVITPTFEVTNANSYDDYDLYLHDDKSISYAYHIHDNFTEDDYIKYFCDDSWVENSEEYTDVVNGDVQTIEVNGKTIKYIVNSYTFDKELHSVTYYAFTPVDNDILAVTVDYSWFRDETPPSFSEDDLKTIFENLEVK